MSKHKQKVLKIKKTHRNRRLPILVGLAVAFVAAPASWLMVHAQVPEALKPSDTALVDKASTDGGKVATGSRQSQAAAVQKATAKAAGANQAKAAADAKKATPSSAAKDTAKTTTTTAASATPTAATPHPSVAPQAASPPAAPPTGWHDSIKTTIFWIGEAPDASNANISNAESAWDGNWQTHFGGFDDPAHRNGYYPAAFTPKENPFYFALPYNDLDDNGNRKSNAGNCPNSGSSAVSWCKNAWIKVTKGSKTAYAQWQDVGPLEEDDSAYVFGTAKPKNTWGAKAGLDVSPAMRDYLGLQDVDITGWSFVSAGSVPAGPWKTIVTTSPGGW